MVTISRDDFVDEKSKMIYDYRLKYYETRNYEHILDMVIEEYYDFARRLKNVNQERITSRISQFDGKIIIYGAGVHAKLTRDFLKREFFE